MELAIVIPTYNRFTTTKQCIDCLRENKSRNDLIIVCDSSSTDHTKSIQNIYDNLIFIDVGPDAWWSAAVNVGVKKAINLGYKHVLILNDDLNFNIDLIEKILIASIHNPGLIISASQEVNSKIFIGSLYLGIFKRTKHIYLDLELINNLSVEVATTNGSCLLIPSDVFKKIGYFDEVRCPHLYGDTQFQLKALGAGIKTICDLSIRIIQQPSTNYFKKLSLSSMFVDPGSPLKVSAYWVFCITLFGSCRKAIFFGVWHHYYFIKQTVKVFILRFYGYLNLSVLIKKSHDN